MVEKSPLLTALKRNAGRRNTVSAVSSPNYLPPDHTPPLPGDLAIGVHWAFRGKEPDIHARERMQRTIVPGLKGGGEVSRNFGSGTLVWVG